MDNIVEDLAALSSKEMQERFEQNRDGETFETMFKGLKQQFGENELSESFTIVGFGPCPESSAQDLKGKIQTAFERGQLVDEKPTSSTYTR